MRCIKCGVQNVEFAKFCYQCGTILQSDLEKEKHLEKTEAESEELVGKHDKYFFLLSIFGGSFLVLAVLLVSVSVAATDPIFFIVLRVLALLILVYVIVIAVFFVLKMWPLIKKEKSRATGEDAPYEADTINNALLVSAAKKHLKFGGAVFAAVIISILILTALLPRAQFDLKNVSVQEKIVYGDKIIVFADIENFGRASGYLDFTVFIDNVEVQYEKVLLGAKSRKTVEIALAGDYQPGFYQYSLGLGALKTINHNNTGQFRVLTPAELIINSLVLSPKQIDINLANDTTAKVEVANLGEAGGVITLVFNVDGMIKQSEEIFLEGKSKKNVDFPLSVDAPGLYKLAVNGISEVFEVFKIERPSNGKIMINKLSGGNGLLKVSNNYDVDVVFIFVKPNDPSDALLAVYVHANSSATVRGLRDGNYLGYYSTGLDWDSHSKRFTSRADHGRYEDQFDYWTIHGATDYTYRTWTVTFGMLGEDEGVVTYDVDPQGFPQIAD